MQFRIADTFTSSLAKLNNQAQKAVKTTVFDLQVDPTGAGMSFHKLDKAQDKKFWSVRVTRDIRIIVHRADNSLLLCYTDHHDNAYDWAERRKLETHPKTGAAQFVQIREKVEEKSLHGQGNDSSQADVIPFLKHIKDEELLSYGVPTEWIDDIKSATEDSILAIADYLPAEAAEAVLKLAVGENPEPPAPVEAGTDPFAHPDAQRRFHVFSDDTELQRALDAPWEIWSVFLHPEQEAMVKRHFNGPARVIGSAGTGKTVVAIHRAVNLAKQNPDSMVLLTTFTDTLANDLRRRVRQLIGNDETLSQNIVVQPIDEFARLLYTARIGPAKFADEGVQKAIVKKFALKEGFDESDIGQICDEWRSVIDAWQLKSVEEYKSVFRLGRRKRLGSQQREAYWKVFSKVQKELENKNNLTWPQLYQQLADKFLSSETTGFQFAIVDESQDLNVTQLRFLAALTGGKENSLFFAGDPGQRIFQSPFPWKSLGIEIQGRSHTLKVNYRTSHQIRRRADNLLPSEMKDADGNIDNRKGVVSIFNGPEPEIRIHEGDEDDLEYIGTWVRRCIAEGIAPEDIAIFGRQTNGAGRGRLAIDYANLKWTDDPTSGKGVFVGTMHEAKGLEFRAVAIIECDESVIPDKDRIAAVTDELELREVYKTERHLLYVAATRARDRLLISANKPGSEFLGDFIS